MVGIPVRFNRMAEAFEEVAKVRGCDSSGSEHSPEISSPVVDLSDLVNSFIENGNYYGGEDDHEEICREMNDQTGHDSDGSSDCVDSEKRNLLKNLLRIEDDLRKNVREAAEEEWRGIGDSSSPELKRRVMARLRERGFDAGLCKSKWEKNGRLPAGNYEYIDINVAGTRYIIDSLAGEFEIARPIDGYASLLEVFPLVSVCKIDELKQVVRIMCNAIKKSMKNMDMPVPPWRRHGYVQAKWFGSYKRTLNEFPSKNGSKVNMGFDPSTKRTVGFVSLSEITYYCREDFGSKKFRSKVGNLAMAINGAS